MILYKRPKPRKTKLEYFLAAGQERFIKRRGRVKDDLALDIGKQIREIREKRGLCQQEFAQLLSMRQSAISRLETGEYLPKLSALKRLTNKLNLSLDVTVRAKENRTLLH